MYYYNRRKCVCLKIDGGNEAQGERKGGVTESVQRPSLSGWLPCSGRSLIIEETRRCD